MICIYNICIFNIKRLATAHLLLLRGLPPTATLGQSNGLVDLLDVEQEIALLLESLVALLALERRRDIGRGRHRLGRGGHDGLRPVVEGILLLVEELGRDLVCLLLRLL